eukprot:scaffold82360_cov33-Phaeocystis_antarctica.AAC.1
MVVNSEYVPIPLSGSACGRRAAARRRRRACRSRSARTRPRSPPRGRVRCAPTPRQTRDRAPPAWRVDGRDAVRSACAVVPRRGSGAALRGPSGAGSAPEPRGPSDPGRRVWPCWTAAVRGRLRRPRTPCRRSRHSRRAVPRWALSACTSTAAGAH